MPFLGFLTGPLGKLAMVGAALAAIALGVMFWLHEHDARILAQQAARAQAVAAAAQLADARAALTQEQIVADAAQARATAIATARTEIANAPAPAAACGVPAAILRAVGAMRASP